MLVYVLNRHGHPLMPCSPRKARLLLKEGKAKVIQRTPFTIQWLYPESVMRSSQMGTDPWSQADFGDNETAPSG